MRGFQVVVCSSLTSHRSGEEVPLRVQSSRYRPSPVDKPRQQIRFSHHL